MNKQQRIEKSRKAGSVVTEKKTAASIANGKKGGRPPEWLRQGVKNLKKGGGFASEQLLLVTSVILKEWKQSKEGMSHEQIN